MKTHSPLRLLTTGAVLALVVVTWVALGPRQLGGSVSYVITHGVSMQPRVHAGDLVILREAAVYREGDVIAYNSPTIGQPVMHRIVDRDDSGYLTKGDNNDWVDTDRPTDADVLGKEWVHIPRAGKALRLVATPPGAAAVAGILGLLLFAGRGEKRRRERKGAARVHGSIADGLWNTSPLRRVLLCATAALALASLLLGGLGVTREPISSLTSEAAYTHAGEFAYSAEAEPGPVYRDGLATTGEPLFINLIDEIDFSFRYRMKTQLPSEITGKAMLWARVSDGSGWKQAFRLQEEIAFGGDNVSLEGTLDPHQVQDLVARVQQQTGVVGGAYTVTLLPTVVVEGTIGDHELEDRYTPTLDLNLENNQLELAVAAQTASDGAEGVDPLRPRKSGSLETSEVQPNTVGLSGLELPVEDARRFSLFGLVLAAAAAFWLWQTAGEGTDADEVTRIQARYGRSMIPVNNLSAQARDRSIEVADMDGLVRLAEHADRMILHEQDGEVHRYFVEDEGVAYVYQPKGGPRLQPEPLKAKAVEPEPLVAKAVAPARTSRAKTTTAKTTTPKASTAKTSTAKTKTNAAKDTDKKPAPKRTPKSRPEASSS